MNATMKNLGFCILFFVIFSFLLCVNAYAGIEKFDFSSEKNGIIKVVYENTIASEEEKTFIQQNIIMAYQNNPQFKKAKLEEVSQEGLKIIKKKGIKAYAKAVHKISISFLVDCKTEKMKYVFSRVYTKDGILISDKAAPVPNTYDPPGELTERLLFMKTCNVDNLKLSDIK